MRTVPRLELIAALAAAAVAELIHTELNVPKTKIFCYSDSGNRPVVAYKSPNSLLPFVSNRVKKIKEYGYPFQYVNTAINPADIASRGCTPIELMSPLWRQGPPFLRRPNSKWDLPKVDFSKVNKLARDQEATRLHLRIADYVHG